MSKSKPTKVNLAANIQQGPPSVDPNHSTDWMKETPRSYFRGSKFNWKCVNIIYFQKCVYAIFYYLKFLLIAASEPQHLSSQFLTCWGRHYFRDVFVFKELKRWIKMNLITLKYRWQNRNKIWVPGTMVKSPYEPGMGSNDINKVIYYYQAGEYREKK